MEYQAKKACRQELKSEKLRAKPLQLRPLGISIVIYYSSSSGTTNISTFTLFIN